MEKMCSINKCISTLFPFNILTKLKTILFFVSIFMVCSLQAKQPEELIREGNAFYKTNNFPKAADCYEEVLENGYEAAELYYNLGNTYFRINNYGKSILNYERALRLSPRDEETTLNLKIANTRITDKIEEVPLFFITKAIHSITSLFSYNTWATLCIIFVSITCIISCIYFLSRKYSIKRWSFFGGGSFLIIGILCFVLASIQFSNSKNTKEAIILQPLVVVKSSPNENSIDKFIIHEGTKVHIEDNMPSWLKIKLKNGNVGWVEKDVLEVI